VGVLIQGPWKKRLEVSEPDTAAATEDAVSFDASNAYPWYALSGPKGIKPAEYAKTLASLKRLARLAGPDGKLLLPSGWFWDTNRIQSLIDQLNQIGTEPNEEEEIPDEPA
jgi:hypothetical protein